MCGCPAEWKLLSGVVVWDSFPGGFSVLLPLNTYKCIHQIMVHLNRYGSKAEKLVKRKKKNIVMKIIITIDRSHISYDRLINLFESLGHLI